MHSVVIDDATMEEVITHTSIYSEEKNMPPHEMDAPDFEIIEQTKAEWRVAERHHRGEAARRREAVRPARTVRGCWQVRR